MHQRVWCQWCNGSGVVQAVPLQNPATMRWRNVSRGTRATGATESQPTDGGKVFLKQPGPAPAVAKDCKRRVPARKLARGRLTQNDASNLRVTNCHGKEDAVQFQSGSTGQLIWREGCHTRQHLVCAALGGLVDIERGRASKRRISEVARIVIINLR